MRAEPLLLSLRIGQKESKKERIKWEETPTHLIDIMALALILVRQIIQNKETAPKFILTLERALIHYS